MALIVIDGLPFLKMGGSFHGYVTNSQMVITPPNSKNFGPKTHVHLQIIGKLMDVHSFVCTNRHRLRCTTGWFCSKRCLITTEYKHIPSFMLLLCQFRDTFFQSFQKPKSQCSCAMSQCISMTQSRTTRSWWHPPIDLWRWLSRPFSYMSLWQDLVQMARSCAVPAVILRRLSLYEKIF